jgi:hypothetical protein
MQSSDKYIFHKDNHKCQNHTKCQNGQNQCDFLQTEVLIFCVEFRELSHLTRDLSQAEMLSEAEQMLKMTFISHKMVKVAILSGNSCHFCHLNCNNIFFSQLEISHVLNGTTPKIQHRK